MKRFYIASQFLSFHRMWLSYQFLSWARLFSPMVIFVLRFFWLEAICLKATESADMTMAQMLPWIACCFNNYCILLLIILSMAWPLMTFLRNDEMAKWQNRNRVKLVNGVLEHQKPVHGS